MEVPPVVYMILPGLISERKAVPEPVITFETVVTLIVPVRSVLGQAVELQRPEALLVILAAFTIGKENMKISAMSTALDKNRHFVFMC